MVVESSVLKRAEGVKLAVHIGKLSLMAGYGLKEEKEYLGKQGLLMCGRGEDCTVFPRADEISNIAG